MYIVKFVQNRLDFVFYVLALFHFNSNFKIFEREKLGGSIMIYRTWLYGSGEVDIYFKWDHCDILFICSG